jgi:putative endonuclease
MPRACGIVPRMKPRSPAWHVYLLRTRDGALYTGIATDVERRLAEHRLGGRRGARSLRGRGPLELVYRSRIGALGLALRIERRIKGRPRLEKEAIVAARPTKRALMRRLGLEA